MTQIEINRLKTALSKAAKLENKLAAQVGLIARIIEESTGIVGRVDYLSGDGFGFTPESNLQKHVGVDEIINWAKNGQSITEELILNRVSF